MTTIAGPKVQPPQTLSDMFDVVQGPQGEIVSMTLKSQWAAFFHSLQQTVFNVSRSGPTASRPTSDLEGRFVGMPYFDTSIGKPVFLKIASTDVWVDAAGAPA